jgi:hypothetical protein
MPFETRFKTPKIQRYDGVERVFLTPQGPEVCLLFTTA